VAKLDRKRYSRSTRRFTIAQVAPLVGMAPSYIKRAIGGKPLLTADDVVELLDQDCYCETFVPRSRVLDYLMSVTDSETAVPVESPVQIPESWALVNADFLSVVGRLPLSSVQCVVTSTPYWGMRIYKESSPITWADGEKSVFGHEQTPEGFLRHTTEILYRLMPALTETGSIWWNLMDTFNTRTQIRGSAVEALRAMQGHDTRRWSEHDYRRYSAGHAYLKDGEQTGIPGLVAQRASRIGYYVKTTITWAKTATLPEPQNSRVSRSLEYILHLSKTRTPKFDKTAYKRLSTGLGGRNPLYETDKLSDVWFIPTSAGGDGHGAQFPLALPARCAGLSTEPGDLVLDPFVGSGNSAVAALSLGRRFLGVDISRRYLTVAEQKITELQSRSQVLAAIDDPGDIIDDPGDIAECASAIAAT